MLLSKMRQPATPLAMYLRCINRMHAEHARREARGGASVPCELSQATRSKESQARLLGAQRERHAALLRPGLVGRNDAKLQAEK